uniref:Uncharacterized protein n=1 Tax=Musa acuminata subsp. malaccensis TaxID=214687 RepID=A0A804HM73_MUSAM
MTWIKSILFLIPIRAIPSKPEDILLFFCT